MAVDDVDAHIEKIVEAGGKLWKPATDVPGMLCFAVGTPRTTNPRYHRLARVLSMRSGCGGSCNSGGPAIVYR
jgi:hypothetical protein